MLLAWVSIAVAHTGGGHERPWKECAWNEQIGMALALESINGPASMTRSRWLWGCVILAACIGAGLLTRPGVRQPSTTDSIPGVATEKMPSSEGFAGWEACRECHAKRVDEFLTTRHFLALQLPEQTQFPRGFDATASHFLPPGSPVRYEMKRTIAGATVTAFAQGARTEPISTEIAFVYGGGAGTDEIYFARRGKQIFELPVAWLHPQDRWGASMFDPHGAGDLSRALTPQCLECHTTWVDYHHGHQHEFGRLDRQLVGVTCERCHGPGQEHVEYHRANPGAKVAVGIVAPGKLSRDRAMDLCAQCHSNAVRYRQFPFSYRPGQSLEKSFRILEMRYPEEDRVANQVRYLKESRCYQATDTLTCATCHDPHRNASTTDRLAAQGCAKCHTGDDCGARDRLPGLVRDRCSDCHMPRRTKVQVAFVTDGDDVVFPASRFEHRIAVYPEAEREVLYEFLTKWPAEDTQQRRDKLAQDLTDFWVSLADSAESEQRFLRAIDALQNALKYNDSAELKGRLVAVQNRYHRSGRLWFDAISLKQQKKLSEAIAVLQDLFSEEPRSAKVRVELGTLLAAVGQRSEGVNHLKAAVELDRNDPAPLAMLGWLELLDRHPETALAYYEAAAEIDPWNSMLEFRRGQCLIQLQRWDDAVLALSRSLEIAPESRDAIPALSQILTLQLSPSQALPRAAELVKLTRSQNPELLLLLGTIYRDLNQKSEARKTLAIARESARNYDPSLLVRIRQVENDLQ